MLTCTGESTQRCSCLTPTGTGAWAVRDDKVSDKDLKELAGAPGLTITEVRAPLSSVTSDTLGLFLETHGKNLRVFNLQNADIEGETLADFAKLMPNLREVSFQYQHKIKNEDLLRIIKTCQDLVVLKLCQNAQLGKTVLYQILELDRYFEYLSMGLATRSTSKLETPDKWRLRAKVDKLRVSGLSFTDDDLPVFGSTKGLREATLSLTKTSPDAIVRFVGTLNAHKSGPALVVEEISGKKLQSLVRALREEGLEFHKRHSAITIPPKPLHPSSLLPKSDPLERPSKTRPTRDRPKQDV